MPPSHSTKRRPLTTSLSDTRWAGSPGLWPQDSATLTRCMAILGRPHGLPPRFRSFWAVFFNDTATTEIYTLSLHDALPICDKLFLLHLTQGAASDLAELIHQ